RPPGVGSNGALERIVDERQHTQVRAEWIVDGNAREDGGDVLADRALGVPGPWGAPCEAGAQRRVRHKATLERVLRNEAGDELVAHSGDATGVAVPCRSGRLQPGARV